MIKKISGFSIIELLFSIAIIATVTVMIIIFYTYMLKVSSKGIDISIATQIAEKKLEEVTHDSTTEGLKTKLISNYYQKNCIIGSEPVDDNIYYYLIYTSPMKGDYSLMDLTLIDIFVFWWASDDTNAEKGFNKLAENDLKAIKSKLLSNDNYSEYSDSDKFIENVEKGLKNSIKNTGNVEGHKFIRLTRLVSTPKN